MSYRPLVIAEGIRWIGTRFHHNARVLGGGVDCGNFLCACYEGPGIVDKIDLGRYPRDWHLHQSEEMFKRQLEKYMDPVKEPKPADVALFRFGKCYSHGVLVVEWPIVIHAHILERKVAWGDASKSILASHDVLFYSIEGRL